jgi:putative methylase
MPTRAIKIRKHDLALKLQEISEHPNPKIKLEQYTITADLAAELLFQAAYAYDDIENKQVIDLGTGPGRLAIGASIIGARYVVGVDLDLPSLQVASTSARKFGQHVDWVLADIETLRGSVDTVLMNPPFGTKQPHADIRFMEIALKIGKVIYSLHKSSTRNYIEKWLRGRVENVERILSGPMEISHQFAFHKMKRRRVDIDVFRIQRF